MAFLQDAIQYQYHIILVYHCHSDLSELNFSIELEKCFFLTINWNVYYNVNLNKAFKILKKREFFLAVTIVILWIYKVTLEVCKTALQEIFA